MPSAKGWSIILPVLATIGSAIGSGAVTYVYNIHAENKKIEASEALALQSELQDEAMKMFYALQVFDLDFLNTHKVDADKKNQVLRVIGDMEIRFNPQSARWRGAAKPLSQKLFTDVEGIRVSLEQLNDPMSLRPVLEHFQNFLVTKDELIRALREVR